MIAPDIRRWWTRNDVVILRFAVALMSLDALVWLGYAFRRLVWETDSLSAVDLKSRYLEVHQWFAGANVYGEIITAVYPPATYAMLLPILGWISLAQARWLWAILTLFAIAGLVVLVVRESHAQGFLEKAFFALIFLATYPVGSAIGNGQQDVITLALLLAGIFLVRRERGSWRSDLLAAPLLLASLAKPTNAAPFFWIVIFAAGRWLPVALAFVGYLGLTWVAASYQPDAIWDVLRGWLVSSSGIAKYVGPVFYANVHTWLAMLGMKAWMLPASAIVLAVLGWWMWRHRHADIWILIGVAAVVTRFWTYHRVYDDVLILLTLVALFRIAKQDSLTHSRDVIAGILLVIVVVTMLAPPALFIVPPPWNIVFTIWETSLWFTVLAFLLVGERRQQRHCATAGGTRPSIADPARLGERPRRQTSPPCSIRSAVHRRGYC